MESIESIIKAHIRAHGPMDIGTYMGIALGHPTLGYYITRDPLGADGDFTTSPEISQLFGEMIGMCMADAWLRAGSGPLHLVEFGPGRGTLMADLLRATKNVPGFHDALHVHLVETSPTLRAKQAETLMAYHPQWHDSAQTLPVDAPLYIVANEFFDALPVRQIVMHQGKPMERTVGLDDAGNLCFGLTATYKKPPFVSGVFEYAPIREAVMADIAARIAAQGGMLLAIDYGHDTPAAQGDTFQALYKHTFCDPLTHVGAADLTSHVDFHTLKTIAINAGCDVYGSVYQKDFLEALGIHVRLAQLNAPTLHSGVARLLDANDMGTLFRVLSVTSSGIFPAGLGSPHGREVLAG